MESNFYLNETVSPKASYNKLGSICWLSKVAVTSENLEWNTNWSNEIYYVWKQFKNLTFFKKNEYLNIEYFNKKKESCFWLREIKRRENWWITGENYFQLS